MKTQELSINGELFDEFRNNLDMAMKILINRMITTRISKGTVSEKDSMKGNMQKGLQLRRNSNGQLLIGGSDQH